MKIKLKDKIKKHFEEVLKIKTSPSSIAAGFALGTFIAILPTFGLGLFIGLWIILIFKNMSKISMMIAFAIWNPFVLAGLYPLSYEIGEFILKGEPVQKYNFMVLNQFFTYSKRFILGNIILSTIISSISYFIIYYSSLYYKEENKDDFLNQRKIR